MIFYFVYYISQIAGAKLPYDTLGEIRDRLTEVSPTLTRYGDVEAANFLSQACTISKVRLSDYTLT
jgi:NADH dehydrogenase (ubiquinone) Fe-S protein 1